MCHRPARTPRLLLLIAALLTVVLPTAAAQGTPGPIVVGVIASRTGEAAAPGAAQYLIAAGRANDLRAGGGIFGVDVRIELRDDGGSPAEARRQAEELIEQGALVIVCCTTPAASREAAAVAEAAGVPLLAPTTLDETGSPYWAFSLAPDGTDAIAAIVADAYREGRPALALMAVEGDLGDAAEADLRAHLAVVGATITHQERYEPGVRELRPEALLVAASQPGGVVVWGLESDLLVAYEALRRRGYEGSIYGRTALLQPGARPLPWARLLNARFAVPPAAAPPASPPEGDPSVPRPGTGGASGACAAAAFHDAERLGAYVGASSHAVATAPLLAALDLVEAGLEQLIALQIPSSEPAVLRQALRDALVGRPARCTGAGLIDLRDGQANAVEPAGLAIAQVTSRGLAPLR